MQTEQARGQTPVLVQIDELPFYPAGRDVAVINGEPVILHEDESVKVTAETAVTEEKKGDYGWTADVVVYPGQEAVLTNVYGKVVPSSGATLEQLQELEKAVDFSQIAEVPTYFGAETDPVLKAPEKGMSVEELTKIEAEIAEKLLQQNGWEILAELARNATEQIGLTKCYVLPILVAKPEVLAKLGEHAEQFEFAFEELRSNIEQAAHALLAVTKQHSDRRGVPQPEDYDLVATLADAYNNLLHQFDLTVGQVMLKQLTDLEQFGIDGEYLFAIYQKLEQAEAAAEESVATPAK